MALIPQIQEHPPTTSDTRSSTPDTPKSRIRSLFHWRKPSNISLRPTTRSGDECAQQTLSSGFPTLRRPSTPRKGIESTQLTPSSRTHSPNGQLNRKQEKLVVDPPPLIQVQRQAILHATLETPVSFTDKLRRRRGSTGEYSPRELAEHAIEVKRSHKRTVSGESMCSTQSKNFFLINGSYLLQYAANAEGDALPEKILILDRDCVAFACDVVPGRPWVLQITKTSSPTFKGQGQTLKPGWSRLALRHSDDKRIVNTMLLVFEDSEELYTWLFAVRKEIEELGGIEYRPDAEQDDQTWRDNLTQKFATTYEVEPESIQTAVAQTLSPSASLSKPNTYISLGSHFGIRPYSARSSGSSKKTSTSLDRLRDSMTSDGYTSTLATCSADGSVPSTSPICENFPSIKSVTDFANRDLSLRAFSLSSGSIRQQSRSPLPAKGSILERRKLSMSSLHLIAQEDPYSRRIFPNLPSTISGSPNDDFPAVESPKVPPSIEQAQVGESASGLGLSLAHDANMVHHKRASGTQTKPSSRKPSISEPTSGGTKPKYSLFPVRPTIEPKAASYPGPQALPQVVAQPPVPRITMTAVEEPKTVEPKHRKSRSRTVTLELRQHRVSALLALGDFDMPQRSPAVTDDMILSNFGMARDDTPPSPMPEIKVPGLCDLKFDLDFLKTPYQGQTNRSNSTTRSKRVSGARSISSVHSDAGSIAKAPLGPPPTGPLPAVPKLARGESRGGRSSRRSSNTQSGGVQVGRKSPQEITVQAKQDATSPLSQTTFSPHSVNRGDEREQTPLRRHRRTISSSLDAPPPFLQDPSKPPIDTMSKRTRSRSRGRPRSSKQQV